MRPDKDEVIIYTTAERHIRRSLNKEKPSDFVTNVIRAGGLWDEGEFFPYHSTSQFVFSVEE